VEAKKRVETKGKDWQGGSKEAVNVEEKTTKEEEKIVEKEEIVERECKIVEKEEIVGKERKIVWKEEIVEREEQIVRVNGRNHRGEEHTNAVRLGRK
jgi:hypothetical protein